MRCPNAKGYKCLRCNGTLKDPYQKILVMGGKRAVVCQHCKGTGMEPCERWCQCQTQGEN